MSTRVNQLFLISPESYLHRTVLFSNDLATPESSRLIANKLLHHVDIEPVTNRSRVRLFSNIHEYAPHSDVPMISSCALLVNWEPLSTTASDKPPFLFL